MGKDERANPFARMNRVDGIVDARSRKLEIGDEIILNTGNPIYFRVIDIKPVLDPKAPPGLQQIEVAAGIHFYAPKGVPQKEFIRVRTAEEAGPSNMIKLDDAPPQADPGSPGAEDPPADDRKIVLP